MSKELPPICDSHLFAPRAETVTPTCGAVEGADIYQEVMVISTPPQSDYQAQNGDVCQNCFQIHGGENGVRDQILTRIFLDLASWENN